MQMRGSYVPSSPSPNAWRKRGKSRVDRYIGVQIGERTAGEVHSHAVQSYDPRVEQYAQLIALRNPAPVPLVALSRRIVPPTGLAARISARVRLHYRAVRVPLIGRLSKPDARWQLTADIQKKTWIRGPRGAGTIDQDTICYIAYPFQRYLRCPPFRPSPLGNRVPEAPGKSRVTALNLLTTADAARIGAGDDVAMVRECGSAVELE